MCFDLINVVLLETSPQSLNYVYSCDLNVLYRCPGKMAFNSLQLLGVLLSLLSLELGRCSSDLFLSSRPRTGLATTCIIGYG